MPYNPTDHSAQNIPLGAYDKPLDGKFMFYDKVYFKYRPFISNNEVLNYFIGDNRKGNFDILINTGGTLTEGVVIGGSNSVWWFKDGIADSDLNSKSSGGGDLTDYYTITQIDNLLDTKVNLTGANFTGNISAPNLSGNNTGDQNLDEVLKEGNNSLEEINLLTDPTYSIYSAVNRVIPIYSDSNGASGVGSQSYPFNAWPILLAKDLNVTIGGFSIPNQKLMPATMPPAGNDNSLYARMTQMLPYIDPIATPVMIIQLGTNDAAYNPFGTARFTNSYNEIIDYATITLGWPANRIYIVNAFYRGEFSESGVGNIYTNLLLIRDLMTEVATNKGVNLIDFYTASVPLRAYNNKAYLRGDNIHLSPDVGHPFLRDLIKNSLPLNEFYTYGADKLKVEGTITSNKGIIRGDLQVEGASFIEDTYHRGFSLYDTQAQKVGDELTTTFTLGAGWSGDNTSGMLHTPGNIESLVSDFIPVIGTTYSVSLTVTGRTAGTVATTFAGGTINNGFVTQQTIFKATTVEPFTMVPSSTLDGIYKISIRPVVGLDSFIQTLYGGFEVRVPLSGVHSNTDYNNLFIGRDAGKYLYRTTGNSATGNTVFGNNAGSSLTEGYLNVLVGTSAGNRMQKAWGSTAIGQGALASIRDGFGLVGIGYNAANLSTGIQGTYIGSGVAPTLTTGVLNTIIGWNSGNGLTTGSQNTIIGANLNISDPAMSNTLYLADGNNNPIIVVAAGSRVQRRFLATPTGATGPFGSRVIDNLDLPVVDVIHGGNGISVYAIGDLTYAATTTTLARRAAVATGSVLLSQGVGVAPIWGKVTSAQVDTTIAITASPTFTGTPLSTTATPGTNTTQIATTAFATAADNLKANIASPIFTGVVTSPAYSLSALNTAPASSTSTGTTGEIRVTSGFIYVCTATNTWVRTALTTW